MRLNNRLFNKINFFIKKNISKSNNVNIDFNSDLDFVNKKNESIELNDLTMIKFKFDKNNFFDINKLSSVSFPLNNKVYVPIKKYKPVDDIEPTNDEHEINNDNDNDNHKRNYNLYDNMIASSMGFFIGAEFLLSSYSTLNVLPNFCSTGFVILSFCGLFGSILYMIQNFTRSKYNNVNLSPIPILFMTSQSLILFCSI